MKLARKLTLALVVLAIAVIAGLEAIEVVRESSEAGIDMEHDHLLLGRALAGLIVKVWQLEGEREALSVLSQANRTQEQVRLRWVWWDVPSGPFAPEMAKDEVAPVAGRPVSRVVRNHGPGYRATYVPLEVNGRLGAIEITESLLAQRERLRRYVVEVALAATAVLLLFMIGAVTLGRRLIGEPVERLVDMARRIGSGDFSIRTEVASSDELGALSGAMNQMGQALQAARERLLAETRERLATLETLRHADRLSTVGKLASGVAHELGTPLNVVSGRAKMISSGEVDGQEVKDCARIISEQTDVMTKIIRQLLDFARRRTPRRAPESLGSLVSRTITLLRPLATRRGVELRTDLASEITTEIDASQIQQVLTNLVMNAIQATPGPGKVEVKISRACARPPPDVGGPEANAARIDVVDRGTGISPEVLPRIFEPFFTTKDVGEGTGLGLSVSYGLVREHGGWIAVESTPGQGSTFSVFLPQRDP